jgi:hypothetical protein
MEYVEITDEMISTAIKESKRRDEAVTKTGRKAFKHHFTASGEDETLFNNVLGFLGQFAFCVYTGQDWRSSIREDYETIGAAKIEFKGNRVGVKTERIAPEYLERVVNKTISEKENYSSCLYPLGQINLLKSYNIIFFGAVDVPPKDCNINHLRRWYPLGWIEAEKVIECPISPKTPSGARLPYPGFHVIVRNLKRISELNEVKPNKLMYRKRSFDVKGFVVIDSTDIDSKKKDIVTDFAIHFNNRLVKELERRCVLSLKNGTGVNLAIDEPNYSVRSENNKLNFFLSSNKWDNILPWDEKKAYRGGFFQVQFWLPEKKGYLGNLKNVIDDVKQISGNKPLKRALFYVRKPLARTLLDKCKAVGEKGNGLKLTANMYFRIEETNSWRGVEHKFEVYSKELGNALMLKLLEENDDADNFFKVHFNIEKDACT